MLADSLTAAFYVSAFFLLLAIAVWWAERGDR